MSLQTPAPDLVRDDCQPLIGLAPLARMAFAGQDLGPFKARLLERLSHNENDANALMDLSTVVQLMGQRECGLALQALALEIRQVYRVQASSNSGGIRLLVLLNPGDLAENNALEFLVEELDITLDLLYVSPGLPVPAVLPAHDLAIVAACESDRNRLLLQYVEVLANSW